MARRGRSERSGTMIWPGFVDAMTALLLVVMFVLSIFMIVQFVLREELTGKDRSLAALSSQLSLLNDELSLSQSDAERFRAEALSLSELYASERRRSEDLANNLEIQTSEGERLADELAQRIAELAVTTETLEQRDSQINDMSSLVASLQQERDAATAELEKVEAAAEALTENERLKAQVAAIRESLARAAGEDPASTQLTVSEQIAALELALNTRKEEAEEALLLLAAAEAKNEELSEEAKAAAEQMSRQERLQAFARASLAGEQELNEQNRVAVALLNNQVQTLRRELSSLRLQLDASDEDIAAKEGEIADLGERLNRALADKVNELQRYRSEFFGRLREVLGDRDGVQIVGDRFVFQSEVLFDSGSADLGPAGQRELARFADIWRDAAREIPDEISWILRVDGHTDIVPLGENSEYASNWELSQARALSVVEYLINQENFTPERLAATGFGEHQPIAEGESRDALRRNRRIELKLTER